MILSGSLCFFNFNSLTSDSDMIVIPLPESITAATSLPFMDTFVRAAEYKDLDDLLLEVKHDGLASGL